MDEITIRDLRSHGGEVLNRVERGETVVITRYGRPVGEVRPVPRPRLSASAVLTRWRAVPAVDAARFREDIDAVLR